MAPKSRKFTHYELLLYFRQKVTVKLCCEICFNFDVFQKPYCFIIRFRQCSVVCCASLWLLTPKFTEKLQVHLNFACTLTCHFDTMYLNVKRACSQRYEHSNTLIVVNSPKLYCIDIRPEMPRAKVAQGRSPPRVRRDRPLVGVIVTKLTYLFIPFCDMLIWKFLSPLA